MVSTKYRKPQVSYSSKPWNNEFQAKKLTVSNVETLSFIRWHDLILVV